MQTWINPADSRLQYIGRINRSNPEKPVFYYAGSSVTLRFQGDRLAIRLENRHIYNQNSIGCVIDGQEQTLNLGEGSEPQELEIVLSGEHVHTVTIFKRQDATHFYTLTGLWPGENGQLLEPPALPAHRLEFYGDSVSAGAVCEAIAYTGQTDPEHQGQYDNAWQAFPMKTGRLLGAAVHNIAQGGMSLVDGSGYFHAPDYFGLESVYDKLCYFPEGGISSWDFSQFTPDAVIFAIGQNDHRICEVENQTLDTPERRTHWKQRYLSILRQLRKQYPNAVFILTLTVLFHDMDWETVLDEIAEEAEDPNLLRFRFRRTGAATPGHPRIPEQDEMAEELAAFLCSIKSISWDENGVLSENK